MSLLLKIFVSGCLKIPETMKINIRSYYTPIFHRCHYIILFTVPCSDGESRLAGLLTSHQVTAYSRDTCTAYLNDVVALHHFHECVDLARRPGHFYDQTGLGKVNDPSTVNVRYLPDGRSCSLVSSQFDEQKFSVDAVVPAQGKDVSHYLQLFRLGYDLMESIVGACKDDGDP